jgi:glycosyltransferase involved in cell wall biosynthesis
MLRPDGISFCVHTFNEATELRRLVESSLMFSNWIDEWVIVDHRSEDDTPAVIEGLRPILAEHNIRLTTRREERDLSKAFAFADIRNMTLGLCRNEIASLMDADFILGPAFQGHLERSLAAIRQGESVYYAGSYSVPVVWDRLMTDARGRITDHGRVWVHQRRPRILHRPSITFHQTGAGGRWEKLIRKGGSQWRRQRDLELTDNRRGAPFPNAVISCNVKGAERIALRDTMTMYMEDVHRGRTTGTWLENYRAGKTRSQGEYPFQSIDLRGWRINAPNLKLGG